MHLRGLGAPALDEVGELARRIRLRLKTLIELLGDRPLLGVQTEDPTIRRLSATPYPYLVLYEVTGVEVVIHAVRHGARDPSSMPGASNP